jgi:hypothetical protein
VGFALADWAAIMSGSRSIQPRAMHLRSPPAGDEGLAHGDGKTTTSGTGSRLLGQLVDEVFFPSCL